MSYIETHQYFDHIQNRTRLLTSENQNGRQRVHCPNCIEHERPYWEIYKNIGTDQYFLCLHLSLATGMCLEIV